MHSRYKRLVLTGCIFLNLFLLSRTALVFADTVLSKAEIHLKNGDIISGIVISEDDKQITIESDIIGIVSFENEFVREIIEGQTIETTGAARVQDPLTDVAVVRYIAQDQQPAEPYEEQSGATQEEKPVPWQREFSMGYTKTSGNTQSAQLTTSLLIERKTDDDEFTLKGSTFYTSSNKKMDAQKWSALIRYAFGFWGKKWYNFYKLESGHDKFANIDYRLIPSIGVGYWFSDTDDWKALVECGAGFEHTNYGDDTKNNNTAVLIPRAFIEKKLLKEARISQDLTLYPSLEDTGEFRLHSETALTSPISESLSLRLSFVDEYNSEPAQGKKKNDTQVISSLIYSF